MEQLSLHIDTGSDIDWVNSDRLPRPAANTKSFNVRYTDGSVAKCKWVNAKIGTTDTTAQAGQIGSNANHETAFHGRLALGVKDQGAQHDPLWYHLDGHAFSEFGLHVGRHGEQSGGTLTLGGVNQHLYQGRFAWGNTVQSRRTVSRVKTNPWDLALPGIGIAGKQPIAVKSTAAIDSGASTIRGPAKAVAAVYKAAIPSAVRVTGSTITRVLAFLRLPVKVEEIYVYPYSSAVHTISLELNGKAWPLDNRDLCAVAGTMAELALKLPAKSQHSPSNMFCVGSLVGHGTSDWILDGPFLKNVYTWFKRAPQQQIGFARLPGVPSSP